MLHKEYNLQKQICNYLNVYYKDVLFMSDTIANVKLNISQAGRNAAIQKKGFHCPDLIIFLPNKKYHGLFLELKIETPFKLDGNLKSQKTTKMIGKVKVNYCHLRAQQESMDKLNNLGYYANFCWSFQMFEEIFKKYINNEIE